VKNTPGQVRQDGDAAYSSAAGSKPRSASGRNPKATSPRRSANLSAADARAPQGGKPSATKKRPMNEHKARKIMSGQMKLVQEEQGDDDQGQ